MYTAASHDGHLPELSVFSIFPYNYDLAAVTALSIELIIYMFL